MNINCLIVDDEHLARKLLEDYLQKLPNIGEIYMAGSGKEALEILHTQKIHLLLLDIQMPDLSGLELLKTLQQKPAVIFTTAYSEYALDGYDLNVTDYLLKPIAFERFVTAVKKATERIKWQEKQAGKDFLLVKADYKLLRIKIEDIIYIEGLREYVSIYTKDKRTITLESMKNLERIFPGNQFMRIHKSYIVSLDKSEAINGNNIEISGKLIPIGKTYKDEVLQRFMKH